MGPNFYWLDLIIYVVIFCESIAVCMGSVFLINNVFKWKINKLKRTYIVAGAASLLYGLSLVGTITMLNQPGDSLVKTDLTPAIVVVALIIYLICNLDDRLWKRIILVILCVDIASDIYGVFSSIAGLTPFVAKSVKIMFHVAALVLFFLFLFFLSRIGSRTFTRRRVPLHYVVLGDLLLGTALSSIEYTDSYTKIFDIHFEHSDFNEEANLIMYYGVLLIVAIVLFIVMTTVSDKHYYKSMAEMNSANMEAQSKYYEALESNNKEIRRIKHDMRNHLTVLALLMEDKDYTRASEYISEIGNSLSSADIKVRTGNPISDAVILDKLNKAESLGIKINIDGVFSYKEMSSIDICTILANILDNAIEAVSEVDTADKVITLNFKRSDNFFMISSTNPTIHQFKHENTDIVTTKKDRTNHGFGIYNIREAASHYNGEVEMAINPVKDHDGLYEFAMDIIIPNAQNA